MSIDPFVGCPLIETITEIESQQDFDNYFEIGLFKRSIVWVTFIILIVLCIINLKFLNDIFTSTVYTLNH